MLFGLTGPNMATLSACASSNHAIGEGMRLIRDGYLDLVRRRRLRGGDHPAHGGGVRPDDRAHEEPRPRDRLSAVRRGPRTGSCCRRARCALILESRGARGGARRARLRGGRRATAPPTTRTTSPRPTRRARARRSRCAGRSQDAGAEPDGRRLHQRARDLDAAERRRRDRRDQGRARRGRRAPVAVSSTKSMTGHMLGAAGAVEGAACALAITNGRDPPDDPLRDARPRLRPRRHAERGARSSTSRLALSNSFGFGGQNACVAFRRMA